ncbi:MAG: glycosyltransferase [Elusimicrobia bacterium]|nr:glycosyltransferase [Elusimicrobiota bacterium]
MSWRAPLLLPVLCSGFYWVLVTVCLAWFLRRRAAPAWAKPPRVSLIKPLCGVERGLEENLATALAQDYPDYEVVFSLQDEADPARAVAERLRARRPDLVKVVVDPACAGPNGRLCNILTATKRADGEVLVYSDSDMHLDPGYLRAITAPLSDAQVGVACTLYRAWRPRGFFETLELLSLNAEFVPSMVFATVTGASAACPGASQALRRETLERIGGLEPMADTLVEDFELGTAVLRAGLRIAFVPHVARTGIDLRSWRDWWRHQLYWDQNTRAASPAGFFFTWLVRGVPFAVLYALLGGFWGAGIVTVTLAARLATGAANAWLLEDADGMRALWALPLRDLAGLATWFAALSGRTVHWKGRVFTLVGNRMVEASKP